MQKDRSWRFVDVLKKAMHWNEESRAAEHDGSELRSRALKTKIIGFTCEPLLVNQRYEYQGGEDESYHETRWHLCYPVYEFSAILSRLGIDT